MTRFMHIWTCDCGHERHEPLPKGRGLSLLKRQPGG